MCKVKPGGGLHTIVNFHEDAGEGEADETHQLSMQVVNQHSNVALIWKGKAWRKPTHRS